jgi:hypothetical protein
MFSKIVLSAGEVARLAILQQCSACFVYSVTVRTATSAADSTPNRALVVG